MRTSFRFLIAGAIGVLSASFAACGGGSSGPGSGGGFSGPGGGSSQSTSSGAHYDSIVVEPPSATFKVALGKTAKQDYKAFGVVGSMKTEITASCGFHVDPLFGTVAGATLTVAAHGGTTDVAADCGSQSGKSKLTVNLTGSVVTGSGTPANAPQLFQAATAGSDPSRQSAVEYPIDQAVAPLNIPSVEMQWTAAGNDLFHVALSSPNLTIDVYTSDLDATLSEADWADIAGTAQGSTLSLAVEGLSQAAPQTKYLGPKVGLRLSHDTIDKTAIYYWASSLGDLMTQTFGQTNAPSQVKGNCTACHSVARSGSRIGYSRCVGGDCGNIKIGFLRYDTATKAWNEVVNADDGAITGSFTTFSPVGNPFPDDKSALAIVTTGAGRSRSTTPISGPGSRPTSTTCRRTATAPRARR